jgi:signal transduction histidine kinase
VALHPDVARVEVRDAVSGALLGGESETGGTILRAVDPEVAGRARFIGYAQWPSCRCILIERSARGENGRRLVLTLAAKSETFLKLLPPQSDYEVSALNGPAGRFIARTLDHDKRFGSLSSTYLRAAVRSGEQSGIYRGRSLEGFENYTAFTRSALTGWTAHLALGSDYLDNPARRFFTSLAVAGLLSLVLAGLLIGFAIRQMVESRRLTERMQQAQKMEALGQLTGGLAHDFNNLLTPVIGVLDQLSRRESLDERGRKLSLGALSSAQRAAKLTQQLLAFSRRQRLLVGPIDVPGLLESVAQLVDRTISGRHVFTIDADPRATCVRSDLTQLELALLNLAINARDAAPDGSVITLRVAHEAPGEGGGEGFVRFAMIDQGSGMDAETKRRALEPFFTTKATGRGTGLGLAQVFGVVEQSGGTVEIESQVGVGTIVTLRLPACGEAETEVTRASAAQLAEPASRALRLLVVDDDPDVRATVAQMLSEGGHSVDSVSNGRSALASLEMEEFDLVVSDYLMPGMSGAELIAEARRTKPEQPFLIVSGFADSEELMRTCPDTARIGKPFTAAELLAAVERAIG